jgi:DNA-binding MarR family transcriptional regulator
MIRPSAPSELTAHLGYWLRYVSNHVSHAFGRKLEKEGVTVAEWAMLRELYGLEATAPTGLAERMGMTRGGVSKLADRLIAKGLILRESHATDRRAHFLTLSMAGRKLVPRLSTLADMNDAQFFGHLAAEDRAAIERAMRSIVERHGLKSIPIA